MQTIATNVYGVCHMASLGFGVQKRLNELKCRLE